MNGLLFRIRADVLTAAPTRAAADTKSRVLHEDQKRAAKAVSGAGRIDQASRKRLLDATRCTMCGGARALMRDGTLDQSGAEKRPRL